MAKNDEPPCGCSFYAHLDHTCKPPKSPSPPREYDLWLTREELVWLDMCFETARKSAKKATAETSKLMSLSKKIHDLVESLEIK